MKYTPAAVSRMGDRAQGRSETPDIPDEWEHVPAPGMPLPVHSDRIHSHMQGMKMEADYQKKWLEWHERDVEARKEQWEARDENQTS